MKTTTPSVLAVLAMLTAGCGTTEKPIKLADLHPAKPSHAIYDPTNDWTTIQMDGGTIRMKGNNANVTIYPLNVPHPIPASLFETLYQPGKPEFTKAVSYLGQKDGYAYLHVWSIPIKNPKQLSKWTEEIVYVPLTNLDQSFLDALPAKGSAQ